MAKFTLSLHGPSLKISNDLSKSSFDYASRHQIIAEIITQYFDGNIPKKILDVGGLGSPLSSILGVKTTILDEEADSKDAHHERGDGARMKLEDNSFDVVVTSDTLEHIPSEDREKFIKELLRVSSDLVILCAPFGHTNVAAEEQKLQDNFVRLTGSEHRWLKEHKAYGLPVPKKMHKHFEAKGVSTLTFNHTSLKLWRTLMSINLVSNEMGQKDIHQKTQELNKFYNKNVLFNDFDDDGYRTFVVASKKRTIEFKKNPEVSNEVSLQLMAKVNDFYENTLVEAEYIPKLRKKIQDMHDEKIELARLVAEERKKYEAILSSKSWKAISKVNSIRPGKSK